jgi:hypothetical protein
MTALIVFGRSASPIAGEGTTYRADSEQKFLPLETGAPILTDWYVLGSSVSYRQEV